MALKSFDSTLQPACWASSPVKNDAAVALPLSTQSKNLTAATPNLPASVSLHVPPWATLRFPFHDGVPAGSRS